MGGGSAPSCVSQCRLRCCMSFSRWLGRGCSRDLCIQGGRGRERIEEAEGAHLSICARPPSTSQSMIMPRLAVALIFPCSLFL